jgi:ASC-1-like (ASCH) protein
MNYITGDVEEPYFSYLLSGQKTVEGRVRNGKWDGLSEGTVLLLSSGLNGTQVEFEVVSLVAFDTFEELYKVCGERLLPDLPGTAWEVYSRWFSEEDERAYGVIGIELKRRYFE